MLILCLISTASAQLIDQMLKSSVPARVAFSVSYPGYVSDVDAAIQTLGGCEGIAEAHASRADNAMEIRCQPGCCRPPPPPPSRRQAGFTPADGVLPSAVLTRVHDAGTHCDILLLATGSDATACS